MDNSIKKAKLLFAKYFATTKQKSFNQFYYDWHSQNMYKPFVELVDYFQKNSNQKEFLGYIKSFDDYTKTFNNDDVKNQTFSTKSFNKTKDGKLKKIANSVDNFAFDLRGFVFSFATTQEHSDVYGFYPSKANMAYAYHKSLIISSKILKHLHNNYDNAKNNTQELVDTYMRDNIFKSIKFNGAYNYQNKTKQIAEINATRKELANKTPTSTHTDLFQINQDKTDRAKEKNYIPNGFELEFYFDEKIGTQKDLANLLKERAGFNKLYFSNSDANVYADANSQGVLMIDESLIPYAGLTPVEYASKILTSKQEEKHCLKILDAFDKGYVNKVCSLHQHLSTKDFNLDTYKRLVKRMIQHEDKIVSSFAAPERSNNKLLYATYISNNLSPNAKSDYPMLCIMADICETKEELVEMTSYGKKYKTLNLVPKHTVEFRYMNAHFNKDFAQGFFDFNQHMINSAINNDPNHINSALLNKYSWKNNQKSDKKTVIKPIKDLGSYNFDSYSPSQCLADKISKTWDQRQARLTKQLLNQSKKASVISPLMLAKKNKTK